MVIYIVSLNTQIQNIKIRSSRLITKSDGEEKINYHLLAPSSGTCRLLLKKVIASKKILGFVD
jgi:hypothetical protein